MADSYMGMKGPAVTQAIDLSDLKATYVLKATDGQGVTLGTLTNDTIGTTAEDGYLSINIGGTEYKIPFWADNA